MEGFQLEFSLFWNFSSNVAVSLESLALSAMDGMLLPYAIFLAN